MSEDTVEEDFEHSENDESSSNVEETNTAQTLRFTPAEEGQKSRAQILE